MKITVEKTEKVCSEIEVPEYFTTFPGWFHRVLPDGRVLKITEDWVCIQEGNQAVKHLESYVKSCTQDEFVQAYCEAINRIWEASGIEHLPLQMEANETTLHSASCVEIKPPFFIYDTTQNPES